MDAALPEEAHIQFIRSGGYQGQVAFVIRLDDYIWLFTDYYGSCSHCDNFIDRREDWLEDMLRKAYCFETEMAAVMYMAKSNDFSWHDISETEFTEMIRSPELNALEGDN